MNATKASPIEGVAAAIVGIATWLRAPIVAERISRAVEIASAVVERANAAVADAARRYERAAEHDRTVRLVAAATSGDLHRADVTGLMSLGAQEDLVERAARGRGSDMRSRNVDALHLLERADAAAANGARVLAWGPSGAGKSTYAQALATSMALASKPRRRVVAMTPGMVLKRAYGEALDELIQIARDYKARQAAGEAHGLSPEEMAFYDALAENESAVQAMREDGLRVIATALVQAIRDNSTVEWPRWEGARAQMRLAVKRILHRFGYPPDLSSDAVKNVLAQAERFAKRSSDAM